MQPSAPGAIAQTNFMRPFDSNRLQEAAELLDQGDVVAVPTETVYGLAARIDRPKGIKKIFTTKARPLFDPLIVHVESFEQARELSSEWSPLADFLSRHFWPGPLTLVVPKSPKVSDMITAGHETVALRMSNHPVFLELIKLAGAPLAAPSANRFGKTSPSRAEHVKDEFPNLFVLDGGHAEVGIESTIIAVGKETVSILRPGAITREDLNRRLLKWGRSVEVTLGSDMAPGQLPDHYQPEKPLILSLDAEQISSSLEKELETEQGRKLKFRKLELNSDPLLAARELYHVLRQGSKGSSDILFVSLPIERSGVWQAIEDRLLKAATYIIENGKLRTK